jgi:hypothetical protein
MDNPNRSPFRSLTNAFFFFGLALYLNVYVTLMLHTTRENNVDRGDKAAVPIDRPIKKTIPLPPSLLRANPPGELKIETDRDETMSPILVLQTTTTARPLSPSFPPVYQANASHHLTSIYPTSTNVATAIDITYPASYPQHVSTKPKKI